MRTFGAGLLLAGLGSVAICSAANGQAMQPRAGTYAVVICPPGCVRGQSAVTGFVVFSDAPLPQAASAAVRSYLGLQMTDWEVEPANACFVLHRERGAHTYAGIEPVGLTVWQRVGVDSVAVALYSSPDAGYDAVLSVRGVNLRGRGSSSGFGIVERKAEPPDLITARRIGPPDVGRCFRAAAREELRRKRGVERSNR